MPTIEISIQTQEEKLHIYKQLCIISLMTVYDRSGANWQWFQVHIENFYTGIVTAFLRARNPCKNTFVIIEVSQKEISVFAQTEKAWKLCMLTL